MPKMRKTVISTATAILLATSFSSTAMGATYEVKRGDSLWKIARQYGTTVPQLKEWNNLKSDLIYPKQVLIVTPDEVNDKPSTPKPKETTNEKEKPKTVTVKTYVVKSGDTLFWIARNHNIKLSQLIEWNNLTSDLIHPGQVLKVSAPQSTDTSNKPSNSNETPQDKTQKPDNNTQTPNEKTITITHKVVKGDTLSHLAIKYNTTVKELKELNGLQSDLIRIGQTLIVGTKQEKVNENPAPAPKENTKPNESENKKETPSISEEAQILIDNAKKLLGTKYSWAGTSPETGFDCSGFIYYVFNQSDIKISRLSTDGYYDRSYYVDEPQPGDLVFFRNTYRQGISHMGIYLGNGDFIHAGEDGVKIANVNNSYWKSKFDGYKKFY